jgi:type II secretory pathway component PulF
MANGPVAEVVEAPHAVAGFAKKNPWAFAVFVLLAAILILRYQSRVKSFLVDLPVVGKFLAQAIG